MQIGKESAHVVRLSIVTFGQKELQTEFNDLDISAEELHIQH